MNRIAMGIVCAGLVACSSTHTEYIYIHDEAGTTDAGQMHDASDAGDAADVVVDHASDAIVDAGPMLDQPCDPQSAMHPQCPDYTAPQLQSYAGTCWPTHTIATPHDEYGHCVIVCYQLFERQLCAYYGGTCVKPNGDAGAAEEDEICVPK